MASDIQERIQYIRTNVLSHNANVSSYVYEKNRRYPVDKGTRAVSVVIGFDGRECYRLGVQDAAVRTAVEEWERRWGKLPWDLVQMMITHVTCQVVVELRVEPR